MKLYNRSNFFGHAWGGSNKLFWEQRGGAAKKFSDNKTKFKVYFIVYMTKNCQRSLYYQYHDNLPSGPVDYIKNDVTWQKYRH